MKATLKSILAKTMTAGLLAGVFMLGGSKKAEAQQFSIGVQVGRPVVYPGYPVYRPNAGYYARHDYYERMRWEAARRAEWERRQAWIRHEQWAHSYNRRPNGYYGR